MQITIDSETLISVLTNLLSSRVKLFDAECSSDSHWCTAISKLAEMIPEYQPTDQEHLHELKYATLHQKILYGQLSADEALSQLEQYEPHPQSLGGVLDSAGLLD
jgi:hypothetical protein